MAKLRRYGLVLTIVVVGVALRCAMAANINNYYWYGGMANAFALSARNIADGNGYSQGRQQDIIVAERGARDIEVIPVEKVPVIEGDRYRPVMGRPPGYSLLLAASYRVFGSGKAVKFAQIVLDSLVCVAVFLLVRHLKPDTPTAGFIGAGLYAIWPPLARNSVHDLPEAFLPFLFAILIMAALRIREWRHVLIFGVAAGVMPYIRTELVLLPWLIVLIALIANPRVASSFVVGAIIASVCVLPVVIRNYRLTNQVVLSSNAGWVLWQGLGEFPNPWGAKLSDADVILLLEEQGLLGDDISTNKYLLTRWRNAIRTNPVVYASEFVRRIPKMILVKTDWGTAEMNAKSPGFQQLRSDGTPVTISQFFLMNPIVFLLKVVPWVVDATIVLIAIVGLALQSRDSQAWLVSAPLLFSFAFYGATHFEPRYIVPAMAAYCVFFAIAVAEVGSQRSGYFPTVRLRRAVAPVTGASS